MYSTWFFNIKTTEWHTDWTICDRLTRPTAGLAVTSKDLQLNNTRIYTQIIVCFPTASNKQTWGLCVQQSKASAQQHCNNLYALSFQVPTLSYTVPTLLLTKKSRTLPWPPWKIFPVPFGAREKKNCIYLQYSEFRLLQNIQHEAKCSEFRWTKCLHLKNA